MHPAIPPITIVGAGISGLTLGLCLKHKGIPAVIYDRATSLRHHSYGIVLRSAAYRPLLNLLRLDEATFRARTAVDGEQRGTGASSASSTDSFRCHRGRLEDLLRKDLTITWNKHLKDVELGCNTGHNTAIFEDGAKTSTKCLIGCDGPHSIVRKSLSSVPKLEVLPYVVFRGKRRIPLDRYTDSIYPHLGDTASKSTVMGDVRLEVSLNEIDQSAATLSYTYSRPARGGDDVLHKTNRSTTEATDIPEEFFEELAELSGLSPPFNEIFNVEDIRKDRILHWLMRVVAPDISDASRLAESGLVLIGDAIHATPILGGEGAHVAIQDSLDLAEHIASFGTTNLKAFTDARFDMWKRAVDDSRRRIAEMHTTRSSRI